MLIIFLCFFTVLGLWPFVFTSSSLALGSSFFFSFCVDYASFTLSLLSFLIFVSLIFWLSELSFFSVLMFFVSFLSSVFCYSCTHALGFWFFYEMSIIPLLVLLVVDSPYSERYVAVWYFLGYVVLGSLPMVLCLFYFSEVYGSFDFRFWVCSSSGSLVKFVGFILGVLFVTKIPLLPFHVWLPIVHAEASSPVSVCLSGYIMKLGLLGVFRFCGDLAVSFFFSGGCVSILLLASVCFFIAALRELDVKRWLAFLSLGHIAVAASCLGLGGWGVSDFCFIYCLGHGLSAAVMFLFVWLISDLSGSRNFMLLKNSLWGSFLFRSVFFFVVCTVSCVPPTIQFFSELFLIIECFWLSNHVLTSLFYIYVFGGGLVPFFFFGFLVCRRCDVNYSGGGFLVRVASMIFLLVWSFVLFLVC